MNRFAKNVLYVHNFIFINIRDCFCRLDQGMCLDCQHSFRKLSYKIEVIPDGLVYPMRNVGSLLTMCTIPLSFKDKFLSSDN